MAKKLAFVLGGGGSRGALQVGALFALAERGLQPDMLVGTSIGSVNAAFLAMKGFSKDSLTGLADAWRSVSRQDLLPANYIWLATRAMFGRSVKDPAKRIREFLITNGISPDLCFSKILHPRLIIVSTNLNTGRPVLHGLDPDETVLEALLLSTALPPWVMPVKRQGHYEMDGGLVSNLPIEPAIKAGATEIIALDLMDTRESVRSRRLTNVVEKLTNVVEKRQVDLEMELAKARGIVLLYLDLVGESPVPIWDFKHPDELFTMGYETTLRLMDESREVVNQLKGNEV